MATTSATSSDLEPRQSTIIKRKPRYSLLLELLMTRYCDRSATVNCHKFWTDMLTLGENFPKVFKLPPFEGLNGAVKQYTNTQKSKKLKNTLIPVLMDSIFRQPRSAKSTDENIEMQISLTSENTRDVLARIRKLLQMTCGRCVLLPPTLHLKRANDFLHRTFIQVFEPIKTATGFRVNLAKSVQFTLKFVYNRDRLDDLRLDLYGDAMSRGNQEVVRMCFRILEDSVTSRAQSSRYVFSFAQFLGKDTRLNMDLNLGSDAVVGEKGWLYRETKALSELGVKITLSGDTPWLLRLLNGNSSEKKDSLSHMSLYISDPPPHLIEAAEKKLREIGKYSADMSLNVILEQHKEAVDKWRIAIEEIGGVLPMTVDVETGKRTELSNTLFVGGQLPEESLVFVESTLHVVPDVTHMTTRIVEHLLKLFAQELLGMDNKKQLYQLEDNITARDVKSPAFTFEKKIGKAIGPVSLSGSDALVIIADHNDLHRHACSPNLTSIFEGVILPDEPVMYSRADRRAAILLELHPNLVLVKNSDNWLSISRLWLAERTFKSLNECIQMYRRRSIDIQIAKNTYESFFQSVLLLFGWKGITPYMAKMDVLRRLVEEGHIESAWDHMTEATEKSHHDHSKRYHGNTMRDGGLDNRNRVSDYTGLFQSFERTIQLRYDKALPVEQQLQTYATTNNVLDCPTDSTPFQQYLKVLQAPLSWPKLDIGKTWPGVFRGMRFLFIGGIKTKSFNFTQPNLKRMVIELGGKIVETSDVVERLANYRRLPHCYCVLPKTELEKDESVKSTGIFGWTKVGDWHYINATYVVDCHKSRILIDPKDYLWPDVKEFRKKVVKDVCRLRERQSDPENRFVLAQTAVKRIRREPTVN